MILRYLLRFSLKEKGKAMALSFTEGPGSKVQLIDRPLGSDLDISDVTSDNPQTLSTATLSFKPQRSPLNQGQVALLPQRKLILPPRKLTVLSP